MSFCELHKLCYALRAALRGIGVWIGIRTYFGLAFASKDIMSNQGHKYFISSCFRNKDTYLHEIPCMSVCKYVPRHPGAIAT